MENKETVYWVLPAGEEKFVKAEELLRRLSFDYTVENNQCGRWLYKDIFVKTDKLSPDDMEAFVDLLNVVDLFNISANLSGKIEIGFSILAGERAEEE